MSRNDAIDLAGQATALLEDPISQRALENMEAAIIGAIKRLDTGDPQNMHREHELCESLRLLATFKGALWQTLEIGKLESRAHEARETRPKRARDPRWA